MLAINQKDAVKVEASSSNRLGFELEYLWAPHPETLRQLRLHFIKNAQIATKEFFADKANSGVMFDGLFKEVVSQLSTNVRLFSGFMPDKSVGPYSLELNSVPLNLEHLMDEYFEINKVFMKLKTVGFVPSNSCGMHIWLDYSSFGTTYEEQLSAIANFYWFIFNEREFFLKVTNRESNAALYNDLYSMLGDPYGFTTGDQFYELFKAQKIELVNLLKSNELTKTNKLVSRLGTMHYKNDKKIFECRWFASTFDTEMFCTIAELMNYWTVLSKKVDSPKEMTLTNLLKVSQESEYLVSYISKFLQATTVPSYTR